MRGRGKQRIPHSTALKPPTLKSMLFTALHVTRLIALIDPPGSCVQSPTLYLSGKRNFCSVPAKRSDDGALDCEFVNQKRRRAVLHKKSAIADTMTVAQRFIAGSRQAYKLQSVKRTTEIATRMPLFSLTTRDQPSV